MQPELNHYMTVAQLREFLAKLKDTDLVFPNAVRNLAVYRGNKIVGWIDFLENCQELEIIKDE